MKRFMSFAVVVVALVCVLLGMVMNASNHAHASFDCHTGCSSWGYWNGTSYGGITKFTVSNPGFYDSIASWDRYMRLGSGNPKIIIGIFSSKGGGYGTYCSGAGSGLKYGVYAYDSTGFNFLNYCLSVPQSDTNYDANFTVNGFGGPDCLAGDIEVYWQFHDFSDNHCISDTEEGTNNWNRIQLQEDIVDHVSGHQVWGSQWIQNQWVSNNGSYVMQTRGEDFLTARNPPQMYWKNEPSTSYPGGQQYSCDYATGTTCTYGS